MPLNTFLQSEQSYVVESYNMKNITYDVALNADNQQGNFERFISI